MLRGLIDAENAGTNRSAAEADLALIDAGDDFADSVIAQMHGDESMSKYSLKKIEFQKLATVALNESPNMTNSIVKFGFANFVCTMNNSISPTDERTNVVAVR